MKKNKLFAFLLLGLFFLISCEDSVSDIDHQDFADDYNDNVNTPEENTGVLDTGVLDTGVLDTGVLDTGVLDTGHVPGHCTDIPPSDEFTCAQQVEWGKCNEPWMLGHCDYSCGRCQMDTGVPDTGNQDTETETGNLVCNIEPVNLNSTQAVRNVLCYLYEIYGNYVLSGQQDCHWSGNPGDIDYIYNNTGQYPAVVGGDFLYTNAVGQAVNSWNSGGLSMIRYHMGRPEDADSYESSLGTTDLEDTLRPGSSRYNGLMRKLDHAASELERIAQQSGAVVIWAPFHEAQPRGWFWWSKGTADQFLQLWQLMFDNFNQRGINNVIWLMPFSGEPNAAWYPGKAQVDIAGSDTYGHNPPFADMFRRTRDVVGETMPIPLHENGNIVNPDTMFSPNNAPWVMFCSWCAEWLRDTSRNPINALHHTYNHNRTLNRGDLPSFR